MHLRVSGLRAHELEFELNLMAYEVTWSWNRGLNKITLGLTKHELNLCASSIDNIRAY